MKVTVKYKLSRVAGPLVDMFGKSYAQAHKPDDEGLDVILTCLKEGQSVHLEDENKTMHGWAYGPHDSGYFELHLDDSTTDDAHPLSQITAFQAELYDEFAYAPDHVHIPEPGIYLEGGLTGKVEIETRQNIGCAVVVIRLKSTGTGNLVAGLTRYRADIRQPRSEFKPIISFAPATSVANEQGVERDDR